MDFTHRLILGVTILCLKNVHGQVAIQPATDYYVPTTNLYYSSAPRQTVRIITSDPSIYQMLQQMDPNQLRQVVNQKSISCNQPVHSVSEAIFVRIPNQNTRTIGAYGWPPLSPIIKSSTFSSNKPGSSIQQGFDGLNPLTPGGIGSFIPTPTSGGIVSFLPTLTPGGMSGFIPREAESYQNTPVNGYRAVPSMSSRQFDNSNNSPLKDINKPVMSLRNPSKDNDNKQPGTPYRAPYAQYNAAPGRFINGLPLINFLQGGYPGNNFQFTNRPGDPIWFNSLFTDSGVQPGYTINRPQYMMNSQSNYPINSASFTNNFKPGYFNNPSQPEYPNNPSQMNNLSQPEYPGKRPLFINNLQPLNSNNNPPIVHTNSQFGSTNNPMSVSFNVTSLLNNNEQPVNQDNPETIVDQGPNINPQQSSFSSNNTDHPENTNFHPSPTNKTNPIVQPNTVYGRPTSQTLNPVYSLAPSYGYGYPINNNYQPPIIVSPQYPVYRPVLNAMSESLNGFPTSLAQSNFNYNFKPMNGYSTLAYPLTGGAPQSYFTPYQISTK